MANAAQIRLERRLTELEYKVERLIERINDEKGQKASPEQENENNSRPIGSGGRVNAPERTQSVEQGKADEEANVPDKELSGRGREVLSTKTAFRKGSPEQRKY